MTQHLCFEHQSRFECLLIQRRRGAKLERARELDCDAELAIVVVMIAVLMGVFMGVLVRTVGLLCLRMIVVMVAGVVLVRFGLSDRL